MRFRYIMRSKCKDIIKLDFLPTPNPPLKFDNLPTLEAIFNNWQDTTNLLLLVIKKVGVIHKLSSWFKLTSMISYSSVKA